MDSNLLLQRLDEIGASLSRTKHALALIGLGSAGLETGRMDAYSDLDFFVIVEAGHKAAFLNDLNWLASICPISYCFANTEDGYKLLFDDGIFCEFAVFEPADMAAIPFAEGRLVWKRANAPDTLSQPLSAKEPKPRSREFLLGEALANLYVGLGREARGEKLSAIRLIQVHAVDRVLELIDGIEAAQPVERDPFANERRFERRYPVAAGQATAWMQGYARNRESALAILAFLEQHFELDAAMVSAIDGLSHPINGLPDKEANL
jgi:hypothetical protein